jgi:hypothetical protein
LFAAKIIPGIDQPAPCQILPYLMDTFADVATTIADRRGEGVLEVTRP